MASNADSIMNDKQITALLIPTSALAVPDPKQRLTGSSIPSRTRCHVRFAWRNYRRRTRKGNCATQPSSRPACRAGIWWKRM